MAARRAIDRRMVHVVFPTFERELLQTVTSNLQLFWANTVHDASIKIVQFSCFHGLFSLVSAINKTDRRQFGACRQFSCVL